MSTLLVFSELAKVREDYLQQLYSLKRGTDRVQLLNHVITVLMSGQFNHLLLHMRKYLGDFCLRALCKECLKESGMCVVLDKIDKSVGRDEFAKVYVFHFCLARAVGVSEKTHALDGAVL